MPASDKITSINLRRRLRKDRPLRRRNQGVLGGQRLRELLSLHERSIFNRPLALRIADLTVLGDQALPVHTPLLGRKPDQQISRSSGNLPQLQIHGRRRLASKRLHIERRELVIAHSL